MFKFTIIAVILFITTAINIIATVISWRRVKSRFGFYFAMGMTGITFWTLASGLDYAAVPIPLKVFFTKWEYVCYHIALVYFLMFILSYAGYGSLLENKFVRTLLWVVPASNVLLAWTNEWHQWLWSGFVRSQFGDNTVIFEHGPAFLWVAGTGYLLIASIVLAAWLASRRGSEYARRQGRLLFYGSLLPLMGNLIYQFQPLEFDGVDWSSILLSISSLLFLWALYGTRLLDLIPIAREKLIDSLSDGMIVLDMQGRIVDINQSAAQMAGFPSEKLLGRNVGDILKSAQSLVEQPPEKEIRTELEAGEIKKRYFDVLVSPLIESQNTIVGRLIIFRDITERKRSENIINARERISEFAASHSLDELLQNALDELCDLTDSPIGFFHFVEPDQHTLSLQNWSTRTLAEFCKAEGRGHKYDIGQAGVWVDCIHRGGPVIHNDYASLPHRKGLPEGHAPIIREMVFPILREGKMVAIIGVGNKAKDYIETDASYASRLADMIWDITERKRVQEELQRLARTDSLTGLFNRRYFFEIAEKEFAKSIRYNRPLSVILFDIDLFKNVNDTFGHLVGDQVLAHIGKLLREYGRETDVAARYGGEEFIVLLTETDCAHAGVVAERLRKLLEDSSIQDDKGTVHFTASFGVTGRYINPTTKTFDQMIWEADQALYKAKEAGRNRVIWYE
jgi:diguanylate cyclase (GGDEF)-like protein/PAS domain S-box-containing protein